MIKLGVSFSLALCLYAIPSTCLAAEPSAPAPAEIKQAVNRSIGLMEKSVAEYPKHAPCFSCHHHGVPALALAIARSHGFAVDAKTLPAIARHTEADLRTDLESYRSGKGQPGGVTRAGYALLALDCTGTKGDEVSGAVAGFLLKRNEDKGYWVANSNRPPSEVSPFTNTYLGIRGLKTFSASADKEAVAARIDKARLWLEQTTPKDTEDRVFQLWGLKEAGAPAASIETSAKALLALQLADGGWAQLPEGASDAYATGSALTVLRLTGRLHASDPAFSHGLDYLLRSQQADGSWHVVTRCKPVQPYFESGFPHGRDQFISMTATAWATAALALATGDVNR